MPNIMTGELPKIRKLTPKECFRLQGFLNDEINLEGLSDTQKYKLAGNGWSINVFEQVFRNKNKGLE
jgi:DNA (cytosine-5)-methyltransferase 1